MRDHTHGTPLAGGGLVTCALHRLNPRDVPDINLRFSDGEGADKDPTEPPGAGKTVGTGEAMQDRKMRACRTRSLSDEKQPLSRAEPGLLRRGREGVITSSSSLLVPRDEHMCHQFRRPRVGGVGFVHLLSPRFRACSLSACLSDLHARREGGCLSPQETATEPVQSHRGCIEQSRCLNERQKSCYRGWSSILFK